MRYIIAKTKKVIDVGISQKGHLVNKDLIILNEKEVMNIESLEGDFESRVQALDGSTHTNTDINNIINKGGWQHGL